MKIKYTLIAMALGACLSLGTASATLVQLSGDASFDGLASQARVPHAAGSVQFGIFNSLTDAAIDAIDAGGFVTPAGLTTVLTDFLPIGLPITNFIPFGADAAGLFTGTVNLADDQNAPVPAGGEIFSNYKATFAGNPIYAVVQAGGELGVYTSLGTFPDANDNVLFTDYAATFGFTGFQPGFNPLIGGLDPVLVGSGVDNQPAGGFNILNDGIGGFGSQTVVTTSPIVIPEPSRAMLLLLGAFGLIARRRRA